MSGDLTHFLAPSSRLPSDITFHVKDQTFPAHKPILAAALPVFDSLFFGSEADRSLILIEVVEEISPEAFQLFLWHSYGRKIEVEKLQFGDLAELHSLAWQYGDGSLKVQMATLLEHRLAEEIKLGGLVEKRGVIKKHKMERLQELLEDKMKEVSVDEENFDVIFELAVGGDAAVIPLLGEFLGRNCPSSKQLASFLCTRPGLAPAVIMEVILAIPEGLGDQKTEVGRNTNITRCTRFD